MVLFRLNFEILKQPVKMKHLLPILMLLLFASCQIKKSLKTRKNFTVSHSLHQPSLSLPDYIPHNSQVIFEITDVNPYLYNIAFTEMQRDVITDMELSTNNFTITNRADEFDIAAIDIGGFSMLDDTGNDEGGSTSGTAVEDFELTSKKLKKEREIRLKRLDSITIFNSKYEELKADTFQSMVDKQAEMTRLRDEVICLGQLVKENDFQIEELMAQRNELLKNMQSDYEKIKIFQSHLGYYIAVANEIRSTLSFYKDLQTLLHTNMTYT